MEVFRVSTFALHPHRGHEETCSLYSLCFISIRGHRRPVLFRAALLMSIPVHGFFMRSLLTGLWKPRRCSQLRGPFASWTDPASCDFLLTLHYASSTLLLLWERSAKTQHYFVILPRKIIPGRKGQSLQSIAQHNIMTREGARTSMWNRDRVVED